MTTKPLLTPPSRTPEIQRLFQTLGIGTGTDRDYYSVMVTWPKGDSSTSSANYNNLFSPKDGVINALTNEKGGDTNGWSELVWYLWDQILRDRHAQDEGLLGAEICMAVEH